MDEAGRNTSNYQGDNLFALLASSNTLHGRRVFVIMSAARTSLALGCTQAERGCSVAEYDSFPARRPAKKGLRGLVVRASAVLLTALFGIMNSRAISASSLLLLIAFGGASAQTLKGSRTAMVRQNSVAQKQDYTFLRSAREVTRFVERGYLVPVRGNSDYELAAVSFPYARPAVKLFIERLAGQYHAACGEKLVVTSLTRPLSRQPSNASDLSVHPAGMAVDLRHSRNSTCRSWLEDTLTELEAKGVLDATKERRPVHYHIAVFPTAYTNYVAKLGGVSSEKLADAASGKGQGMKIASAPAPKYASVVSMGASEESDEYRVRKGDSLWSIAREHEVTVNELREANDLSSNKIIPGQILTIPGSGRASASGAQ